MYDMREVDGAIAELENSEPTMQRVEKPAALYIVKNQHQAKPEPIAAEPVRYYAAAESPQKAVAQGSDFFYKLLQKSTQTRP